jgi:hypothetical protein
MLLTTTAEHRDEELANRCLTLSVCEQPEQTATIHGSQCARQKRGQDSFQGLHDGPRSVWAVMQADTAQHRRLGER